MALELNETAYEHARHLIEEGAFVYDERGDWSEHQPSTEDRNRFIGEYGIAEYAKWHLGVDRDKPRETKGRYSFPYGDFEQVHRCALLAAESRAGQYDHTDIELAVAHLHGMVEAARPDHARETRRS
jgi:hypothetical protein